MIKTSRQLKDKIRNLSGGNSKKAQALLRNYIMERFLERVSVSEYNDNFILKGGMLVSSLVGIDTRATMDIDTTIRSFPLRLEEAAKMINEIISIDLSDNIKFTITNATDIMEEHEYPGLRFMLAATIDNLKQVIKVDISTGDVITPVATCQGLFHHFPLFLPFFPCSKSCKMTRFSLSPTLCVLVSEKCTSTKYVVLSIFFCRQGVIRPVVLISSPINSLLYMKIGRIEYKLFHAPLTMSLLSLKKSIECSWEV